MERERLDFVVNAQKQHLKFSFKALIVFSVIQLMKMCVSVSGQACCDCVMH